MQMELPDDAATWTKIQVGIWLKSIGFESFTQLLCAEHEIDGKALLALTENVSCHIHTNSIMFVVWKFLAHFTLVIYCGIIMSDLHCRPFTFRDSGLISLTSGGKFNNLDQSDINFQFNR